MTPLEDLLRQCTVKITIPGGWGTGFFVAPGLILTCAHVVRKAADSQVTVSYPGWQQPLSAIVKATADDSKTLDLALVELPKPLSDHPCVLLDEEPVAIGQALYSYGYLESYTNAAPVYPVNEGETGDTPPLLKLQGAQIEKGISGAALLNLKTGRVCGIVKETRAAGFDLGGGAIPTHVILEQFPQLRELQQAFHKGNRRWVNLTMTQSRIDFQPYLNSVTITYAKWQRYYTLTDAEGKQRQVEESAPLFDFGLMAQIVPKQEREQPQQEQPAQEKVERFSVLDGLRKYALGEKPEPVLLIGRPGSGKSTTFAKLLLEEATLTLNPSPSRRGTLQERIPVLVELRYWQGSLSDLIHTAIARHDPTLKVVPLDRLLTNMLLLFDGVNELPSEPARNELLAFCYNHPNLSMIFTTRDLSLGGDLGIERKLEMLPLTEPQMQAFIRAYVLEQAEAMLRQLKDRLREFGQTPLLLWMLCEVFKQSPIQQLPTNLGGIFQVFTRTYEDSSVRKNEVAALKGDVKPLTNRRLWKKALMAIAAIMMQGKTPVDFRVAIHRDEAERELNQVFPNEKFPVRDILDDLLKYHLLQNQTTDQIEFRHQLIQEYYAAEHLLTQLRQHPEWLEKEDGQDYTHFQKGYLNYLKWREPIALMLALSEDEKRAEQVVKLAIEVDLMLGARLAGSVRACSQPRTIDLLLQLPLLPELQISCLAETGSDAAIPALLHFLEGQVLETRVSAIYALGKLGSNAATLGLLKALRDESLDIRDAAAEALRGLNPSISIPLSLQLLEDENPVLREIASEILGELNYLEAQPKLLEKLEDQDLDVKASAAIALGKIGCAASIPYLLELLAPPYSYLTWRAAELLGELGVESAIPSLIKALNAQDVYARISVVKSLAKYTNEAAVLGLIEALGDQEVSVKIGASQSLVKMRKEVIIPVLFRTLEDKNPKVRERAIETLKIVGDEIAVPKLIKALEDEDNAVRGRAADALIKSESKALVPDLIELLKHQNPLVRSEAALVLGKMGCDSATPELVQALLDKNQDPFVCINTLIALSRLGKTIAIILLLLLVDLELPSFFRVEIIEVLGELKEKVSDPELLSYLNKAVTPRLLLALKDESSYVRMRSALSLGSIGNIDTVPELIQALSDENKYVRQNVAYSLGKIGSEAAIPRLLQLLEDEDWAIRRSAADALVKLDREKIIQGLLKALENENWDTRRDVIDILGKIGCETVIPKLLNILDKEDILDDGVWEIHSSAIDALANMITPHYLTDLWNIYFRHPEIDLTTTINAIQSRCEYYNYEIWQAHLAAQKADRPKSQNSDPNAITIQTLERLTIMTDKAPIFHQQHATIGVNYAADGSTIEFTQHTSSSEQTFEILLTDYQQFIEQLQQKYPALTDPTTIPQIIEVEAKLIEAQDQQRWQNFLNLKRLWHGSKKAGVKVGEHFAENNVWAKGAIAFLEGVSEDVK